MAQRGESEGITIHLKSVVKMHNGCVIIPLEFIRELDWEAKDEIDMIIAENRFGWGTVKGIMLRNLSKEKRDGEETR